MNQLDATITIYWSSRSARHVLGNLLHIFRSVRLRFLQHMVSCKDGYTESYVVLLCDMLYWLTTLHYTPTNLNNVNQYDISHKNYITICISIFAGHYTICCKNLSYAPEDGHKVARNLLSWSCTSINYCCI